MTHLRVVLQARTTSTRLPAKALLPIAGMPSAILAAKRAARDGLDLVFATSTDPTDDLLAAAAGSAGLRVFRGSKDDVLGRYAAATADLADDDVVLRITGDDPVPDADFLRALAASRARRAVDMLFSLSPADGLPHGIAAQVFTVGALRRAAAAATHDFEREHVGPWLVRNLSSAVFDDYAALDLGHLRCTLDTIDDYFDLQRLFAGMADPVAVPWRTLADKLAGQSPWRGLPFRYLRGHPGGDPGVERLGAVVPDIADNDTSTEADMVRQVRHAIRCGASHMVVSSGASAARLGAALAQGWSGRTAVILRLPPLPADLARSRITDWADGAVLGACRDLGLARLHTILLPDPAGARGTVLIDHLARRQADGWVKHLGVAIATPTAARRWLKHPSITHLELACGPDDYAARGLAIALAARPEVMMLARPRPADVASVEAALGQTWAQGVVVPAVPPERWAALVDGARAARPKRK